MDMKEIFIHGTVVLFLGIGTYFDVKSKELPLEFLVFFGIWGVAYNFAWKYQRLELVFGGIMVGIAFLIVGKFTREAIGYGDGLSFVILGIFCGWTTVLRLAFGAFCLSAIYGLWRIFRYGAKGKERMPLFPFLLISQIGGMII